MANSVLAKMAVQISANTAEFNKSLAKTQKDLSSFTGGITKMAGVLGVAFGTQQIASFVLEISKLAGEAVGVEAAFNRLENSKRLLIDLTDATRGTVSELTLMKRAVQFSNFGLELSKLPTLLEFATRRAQQTGQSVDYLVDSIVTGLGRKSVLILDNLGISAIQLREEMAKVGDITVAVSNIIERDVANSGGIIETTAIRTERLAASWDNFKVAIGKAANDTGILGTALEGLNQSLIVLSSSTLSAGDKLAFFAGGVAAQSAVLMKHYALEIAEANKQTERTAFINKQAAEAFEKFNGNLQEFVKNITPGHKNTELLVKAFQKLITERKNEASLEGTLQGAMEEQAVLQKQKLTLRGEELAQTNIRLKQLDEEIKKLNQLGLSQEKVNKKQTLQFIVPELSGDNANTKAANDLKDFSKALFDVELQAGATKVALDNVNTTITQSAKIAQVSAESMNEALKSMAAGGIASLAEAFGNAIAGGARFGESMLKVILGFASQFGQVLISLGVAALAAWKIIESPAGAVAAIAAGAALVAISAAARSALQSSHSSNFGGSSSGVGSTFSRQSVSGNLQDTTITLRAKGSDLVGVLKLAELDNSSRRG